MFCEFGKLVEVLLRDLFRFVRVDADAGVDPIVFVGVFDRGIEFFGARACADGEDVFDAGSASAIEHGVAIVRELRIVDVRV
jgi:hypothetical protein